MAPDSVWCLRKNGKTCYIIVHGVFYFVVLFGVWLIFLFAFWRKTAKYTCHVFVTMNPCDWIGPSGPIKRVCHSSLNSNFEVSCLCALVIGRG